MLSSGISWNICGTTFVCFVSLLWLSVAPSACAFQLASGEEDQLPPACATDPDYKEFERIQAAAYMTGSALDFRIALSPNFEDEVVRSTINAVRRRSHEKNMAIPIRPGDTADFEAAISHITIPTCYENPVYYFMITNLANDAYLAGEELGLSGPELPKFGSLPSNDINAYTYPTRNGRGKIIAINAQLFNFIPRMTQVAASAVDPTMGRVVDSDGKIIAEMLMGISYNQGAKDNFVGSLLGLLRGKPIGKMPADPSREALNVFFAGAMERFVFAHEYGHVLKRHWSQSVMLPTAATGSEEFEVLARSWPQEFEADAIGLRLVMQMLRGGAADNPQLSAYYIYALKAPLFLFECMEILDEARFIVENHRQPPVLNDQAKALLRECPNNTKPDTGQPCGMEVVGSHPPAWLRRERLEKTINDRLAVLPNRALTAVAAQKGDEMIYSVRLFWKQCSPLLLKEVLKPPNNN